MADEHINIVVIGDMGSGKTSLCWYQQYGTYNDMYIPTYLESFIFPYFIKSVKLVLQIYDTPGSEAVADVIRELYPIAHCFIICYDIFTIRSVESISKYWLQSIQEANREDVPILLCGTKKDLIKNKRYKSDFISVNKVKSILKRNFEVFETSAFGEAQRVGEYEGQIDCLFERSAILGGTYKQGNMKTDKKCIIF